MKLETDSKRYTIFMYILIFLLALFTIILYINILKLRLINPDAGYYLWLVNKISEGKIPGIDVKNFYLPLVFYLLSLTNIFVQSPTYLDYLAILIFVQLINAGILYFIVKFYTTLRYVPVLSFIIYLLVSFHCDGFFLILEPFVTFFGLLSILLYLHLKNRKSFLLLVPGILGALSFFCKQYGLVYFLAVPFLLIIDFRDVSSLVKRMGFYFLGYCIPFSVFFLYYQFNGSGIRDILAMYSGAGYGQRSVEAYKRGLFILIKIYGMFLPFALWLLIKDGFRRHLSVYIYLIFGFSLQFFLYKFPHYYLLLLPFLIITAIITYSSLKKYPIAKLLFVLCILYTILINIYSNILTLRNFSRSNSVLSENIDLISKNSLQLRYHLKNSDKVLLYDFDLVPYCFVCNFSPPLEKEYGLIFYGFVSPDKYCDNLMLTNFVLIRSKSLSDFYLNTKLLKLNWKEIRISETLILLEKSAST